MKKAYKLGEKYRHPELALRHAELVSASPEIPKQVRNDKYRHPELVSGSLEIPKRVRNDATKAFTLAEIMIVLSVIAVLTAILLPAARNAMPNENVLKFKKAHNALHTAISELVNSDKYYLDGNLGLKLNGEWINGDNEEDYVYLCNTLADVINAKKVNCLKNGRPDTYVGSSNTIETISTSVGLDIWCDNIQKYNDPKGEKYWQIVDTNNITYFEVNSTAVFGMNDGKIFAKKLGEYQNYKGFCFDIDGWNKGERPFGYGIMQDGRIVPSMHAQEWLQKTIQEK